MKLSSNIIPAIFTNKINNVQNKRFLPFCSIRNLNGDIFEKTLPASVYKTVTVKDLNNNPVKAVIKEEKYTEGNNYVTSKNPKIFTIYVNKKELGHAIVCDEENDEYLYLKQLDTQEHKRRKYKGLGTELLKCVIEESKNRGYEGKIHTIVLHTPAPFVFYYKNNFIIAERASGDAAAVDYAARKSLPVSKVMPKERMSFHMFLEKEGVQALLENKRLYKQSFFKTLKTKQINRKTLEANLVQTPDKQDYYLQIIHLKTKSSIQRYIARVEVAKDPDGKDYLKVFDINQKYADKDIEKFSQEAIALVLDEFGLDRETRIDMKWGFK